MQVTPHCSCFTSLKSPGKSGSVKSLQCGWSWLADQFVSHDQVIGRCLPRCLNLPPVWIKKSFCCSVGASVGATQLIPVASISGNCVEIVFRWILLRTTWNRKELVEKCQSSDGTEFLLKYKSESSIVEFSVSKISSTYYQYCFQWPMVAKMMSVKITAPGLWLKILRPFFKIQLFF